MRSQALFRNGNPPNVGGSPVDRPGREVLSKKGENEMKRMRVLWCLLWMCGSVPVVFGAEGDMQLETIVVTASRLEEEAKGLTRKVEVITSEEIRSSGARDLADVLTRLTSVNMSNYGGTNGVKNIRMRGSSSAQVLVLLDGRPLNSPRDGSVDLNSVSLNDIDRIEVLYGPAASLYGSQAMGGTVNLISRRASAEEGMKTELTSAYGTFGHQEQRLSHGARFSRGAYQVNASYDADTGHRKNSAYYGKDVTGKFEFEPGDAQRLTLNAGRYQSATGLPGSVSSPDADDDQRNARNTFDLVWKMGSDETAGLETRVYRDDEQLEFRENTAGSLFDVPDMATRHTTRSTGLDSRITRKWFGIYRVVAGFNVLAQRIDSTSVQKKHQSLRAGYLDNQLEFADRMKLCLGGRVDDYSSFGSEVNPSASFMFRVAGPAKLHGLASRSFRAPTFNDLFWPDEGWSKGNPDLKPEKGITREIGLETRWGERVVSDVTYYRNTFKDLINWAPVNTVWQPLNVDSARMDGWEWSATAALCRNMELKAGYTWLNAEDTNSHKRLIYQPKNKVDVSLRAKEWKGFAAEIHGQYTGTRFCDTANTQKIGSFWVWGAGASQRLRKDLSCFLSVDNLFDREYVVMQGYPMPGAVIRSGVTLSF